MRIVFMGTPRFAADILACLLEQLPEGCELSAVYTRPDAVRGRGKKLVPSPVKEVALGAGLPVFEPRTLRSDEAQAQLAELRPDAVLVAAYGMLLPQVVLDIPRFGCFNAHASLLPRWRGAAPVERALLAGDEQVGVCVMKMEAGLDTGDFAYCAAVDCESRSAEELLALMAPLAAEGFRTLLRAVEAGDVPWQRQDEALVTYARKIEKGELDLSPAIGPLDNVRRVRSASEAHPAKCSIDGVRAAIAQAAPVDEDGLPEEGLAPGAAVFFRKRLLLGARGGAFEVRRLKPEGKKEMDAAAFVAGRQNLRAAGATWETE
ncbi:methionyl-tRNA formyltransferase [Parvibacter caecicola]|uniref:methionyl-tRNA formyltransferase n=1 Tax=Parvibacter caecicola TaxID=747645 RepID=UPI0023F56591|nr:methionyl-tRNA formyltransferase [Parvibacter caecicola]